MDYVPYAMWSCQSYPRLGRDSYAALYDSIRNHDITVLRHWTLLLVFGKNGRQKIMDMILGYRVGCTVHVDIIDQSIEQIFYLLFEVILKIVVIICVACVSQVIQR
jgi:hypothetical protein